VARHDSRRPSEWRRLFRITIDLIDQLRENAGGYDFEWSFGGGTAMMIQIGHRESHDIDIFLDDPQLLGFIDPSRSHLHFETMPSDYLGDGLRFQKFAFEGIGEIDFIVAGALTTTPFETRVVEGRLKPFRKLSPRRSIIADRKPTRATSSISPLRPGRNWARSSTPYARSPNMSLAPESGWKSSTRNSSAALLRN
jgi:hypothetical protein